MSSDMQPQGESTPVIKRAWQTPRVIESEIEIRETAGGGKNDAVLDGYLTRTS